VLKHVALGRSLGLSRATPLYLRRDRGRRAWDDAG
jgi:hypothetical protein